jgi:membrane protein
MSAHIGRLGGAATRGLDRFQRRHPASGFPIAVVYKFIDDFGGYLSALIAYYAFVSLFPLLLLSSTILGFVLVGHAGAERDVLNSALAEFPVIGPQLNHPDRIGGGGTGLVVGIVGSLYGGLGVVQALQYAMNTVWAVPRNERRNPISARLRGLVILGVGALAVLGTTALSTFGAHVTALGGALRIVLLAGSVLINAGIFLLIYWLAPARRLRWRDVAPGAVTAALIWQLMQTFGVVYVNHVVRHASATNGVFALVLGLLAFLYLTALSIVVCAEVNVVRTDRLYPRALLGPFTDNVELTRGDESAYRRQATAQRAKGFEDVTVTFDDDDDDDQPAAPPPREDDV